MFALSRSLRNMDTVLAQISSTPWPLFFALFAGFVGMIGCAAAWLAHASTSSDRALIKKSESTLTSSESWEGAYSNSEHELSKWLLKQGIGADSGVADIIRACWAAWIGCRATTLTELHVLVSRRERSKLPARLSGGIAALLLIIGIVGTLSSVKPVLAAFQFRISTPEGEMPITDAPALSNVAESTELVNSLMHNLGDAFLPSLVALVATIFVVAFRGMYSLSLNRYTLELDRFAMGTVMPQYRPRSIADEYTDVRATFDSLAKTIGEREEKFDLVVFQLGKLVDSIKPALSGLENGIAKMAAAGDTLASKSNSIATTLSRMLGKKSPLYGAVYGFEEIFEKTNNKIEQISDHIEKITADHENGRAQMIKTLKEISGTIEGVKGDHKQDREAVEKTIDSLKLLISELPGKAIVEVRETFESGIKTMQLELERSLADQKNEAASTHQVIRDDTRATLGLINKTLTETAEQMVVSAKAIPAALERLDSSLSLASKKLSEATNVIPSVIARIDSTLSGACERLDEATKAIPSALERVDAIVARKSELDEIAAKGIRTVAEEAMSQIRNENRGFDRDGPSVDRRTSRHDDPTPGKTFSDDRDTTLEITQIATPVVPTEPGSVKKIELSAGISPLESVHSADSVLPIADGPVAAEPEPADTIQGEDAKKQGFFNKIFRRP